MSKIQDLHWKWQNRVGRFPTYVAELAIISFLPAAASIFRLFLICMLHLATQSCLASSVFGCEN